MKRQYCLQSFGEQKEHLKSYGSFCNIESVLHVGAEVRFSVGISGSADYQQSLPFIALLAMLVELDDRKII